MLKNSATTTYTRNSETESEQPGMFQRALSEVWIFALIAISVFLILSLGSYAHTDPGWSHASNATDIANWCGRAGAYAADMLLYVFGLSVWWLVLIPLQIIWRRYKKLSHLDLLDKNPVKPRRFETLCRFLGVFFILAGSSAIEFLRFHTLKVKLPGIIGGFFGKAVGNLTTSFLGFNAATLLLLFILAVGINLCFHFSWLNLAEFIGTSIEKFFIFCKNAREAREDRKLGQIASEEREDSLAQVRAKLEEAKPIRVEPQVISVPKSERVEKEKQIVLFEKLEENKLPPLSLLDEAKENREIIPLDTLEYNSRLIEKKLRDFKVSVRVVTASPGPVITRYEIEPAVGVKGSTIVNLSRDLARSLALTSIRVVETIPGKNYMALELPNPKRQIVRLIEILGSKTYNNNTSLLTVALGKDIAGNPVVADLARMPHLLVAGTTGAGKSVGINAIILSLLYKATPQEVRLILIDPKMLELSVYEGIPHLLTPVVTDMQKAGHALKWAVEEMERRYRKMSHLGVRNLASYNNKIREAKKRGETIPNPFSLTPDNPEPLETMPFIVIVIDELADLMMVVGKKVEELIARIAQKARAAGVHLILATQRPSVDVITGLIKANIPTRIAFQVSSKIDSRTILDQMGAENLLGMGDMLYLPPGSGVPTRVHGAFVSDEEIHRVVEYMKEQGEADYIDEILEGDSSDGGGFGIGGGGKDSEYDKAVACVLETGQASASFLQRRLGFGYPKAARMIDQMEENGIISAMKTNGKREILVPRN